MIRKTQVRIFFLIDFSFQLTLEVTNVRKKRGEPMRYSKQSKIVVKIGNEADLCRTRYPERYCAKIEIPPKQNT